MTVRNFWVHAQIDGRGSLKGGPRSKDGGIDLTIQQRDAGSATTALRVTGHARGDALRLDVYDGAGALIASVETAR